MRAALVFSLWVVTALAPATARGAQAGGPLPPSPEASAPALTIAPRRFVLGVHGEAEVRVTGLPPDADLRFAASSGTLSVLEAAAGGAPGGEHRLRWVPPGIRYPTWAVLLVWDARDGEGRVAVARLPLWGRTGLEMATEPNAEVRVEVGGQSFGPVTANARGRVQIPIEVPPGVKSAQVFATAQGQQTTRAVPLEVPATRPLAVAMGPDPMPPTGGWLFAAVGGDDGAKLVASAEAAGLQRTRQHEGDVLFSVLPLPGAAEVTAQVTVPGGETRGARVALGERPPSADGSQRPPPREGGTPPPSPPQTEGAWPVHALVGGYYAGGANSGLALEAGLGYVLPVWDARVAAELAVGLRTGELSGAARLGRVDSSLLAVPVTLSARALLFSTGPVSLHGRAGGGAVPFQQTVRATFQPDVTSRGVGFELFVAGQAAYRAGPVDVVAEVRASGSRARSERLAATPGGLNAGIGVRWRGEP